MLKCDENKKNKVMQDIRRWKLIKQKNIMNQQRSKAVEFIYRIKIHFFY
jgi:hypothetical protein